MGRAKTLGTKLLFCVKFLFTFYPRGNTHSGCKKRFCIHSSLFARSRQKDALRLLRVSVDVACLISMRSCDTNEKTIYFSTY